MMSSTICKVINPVIQIYNDMIYLKNNIFHKILILIFWRNSTPKYANVFHVHLQKYFRLIKTLYPITYSKYFYFHPQLGNQHVWK